MEAGVEAGGALQRVSVNAPLAFDAAVKQVVQLGRGRTLVVIPEEIRPDAERLVAHLREKRVAVLERKLVVQRDELALAEREVEEMLTQVRAGRPGLGADSIAAAWRDIESAGGDRPDTAPEDERLRSEADRKLKEQAVEAQLAFLKKKFGKQK